MSLWVPQLVPTTSEDAASVFKILMVVVVEIRVCLNRYLPLPNSWDIWGYGRTRLVKLGRNIMEFKKGRCMCN